jgi:hypothetical protein
VTVFAYTRGRRNLMPDIVVLRLSQLVERLLISSRHRVAQLANRVEFLVRVEEAKRDPDRRAWASEMKAAVEDGSLLKEIEAQRTPGEILREWRAKTTV